MEFGFLDFYFLLYLLYLFIYLFHGPNDQLDKKKKSYTYNINYSLNIILMINPFHFLSTILIKNYWKNQI